MSLQGSLIVQGCRQVRTEKGTATPLYEKHPVGRKRVGQAIMLAIQGSKELNFW